MTEKMKDGVIRRGKVYYYVIREHGQFPAVDRAGKPKLDAEGRQIIKSVRERWVRGAATRGDTKKLRDAARDAVHKGTYVAPQTVTVGEWLRTWIDGHEVTLKASTAHTYRANIDRYLVPEIGHLRVQSLSPAKLSTAFRKIHESGGKGGKPVSARTVEFCRAILRKAMQDAVVERLIEVNPVVGTKRPRPEKPKHTTWTGVQVQAFLAAVEDDRWSALWMLAAATGARRGELLALRWSDVDLDGLVVSIDRSVTQLGQRRIMSTPKNHERRKVTIDLRTANALRAWQKAQAAERLAAGPAYVDDEGLIFTWADGSPVLPDYVTKAFGKAQAGLGLPRLVLHGMRHSHATLLLRAGVPVHIVAKRLGHKNPSVTLDVYADVIPDDDNRAVDVYSTAVWGIAA